MEFNYKVTLETGVTFEVRADQRDVARFEVHPEGCSFFEYQSRPFTFAQFLAWNAGRRQNLHTLAWAEFSDSATVESTDDGTPPVELDPTQPAASAGT